MKLKYIVIDVDGTLTDSGIYYDEVGNELKKFSTKDAMGFFASKKAGIKTVVITGRESRATLRRMKELKADLLFQNVEDKYAFLFEFMRKNDINKNEIAYIGDDLNDIAAMRLVGYIACPLDSCDEIIEIADYVSSKAGGQGAVRDIIREILLKSGEWMDFVCEICG